MRFQVGPIPEDMTFAPEAEGWTRLREPRPGQLMLLAIPLGMLMAGVLAFAWSFILPFAPPRETFSVTFTLYELVGSVLLLVGFILIHEFLHAVPTMLAGSPDNVVIGFWPRHLAPYVAYTGSLSRGTQLLSGILPFLVLTVLPFIVAVTFPAMAWWAAGLGVLNVLGSAADLVMVVLLARRIPAGALVRNQGYATWWCLRSNPGVNPTTPCQVDSGSERA